jgi:capsular polysaccharide transport system permease protein
MTMPTVRSPLSITLSVWRAIFLREALDRLFRERGAWLWLVVEPMMHISFFAFGYAAIRAHAVGGMDITIWLMVGLLSFFLYRRTAIQVLYGMDCNRPLFAYRQVKPFDAAIVRAGLEAFLMILISIAILTLATLLGHSTLPNDPLMVLSAAAGLWLFAVGYGLVASVLMELVRELEHVLNILMLPLYIISGTILPLSSVPLPYRDWLMINPIAHGLEVVRMGFVPYYHVVPGTSLGYLYAWALTSICLGLLLYRRFAVRLMMQ